MCASPLRKLQVFYSHVICLGTKMLLLKEDGRLVFYSHVICLGTKIRSTSAEMLFAFYSHVICLGTKINTGRFART